MSVRTRLERLEDPRTAAEKARDARRHRTGEDATQRRQRGIDEAAAAHPERVPQYVEAVERWNEAVTAHPDDLAHPEMNAAYNALTNAEGYLKHGYVGGMCCEDCGRGGTIHRGDPYPGTCAHCGGVVSNSGYWYKRIITLDKLERNIAASRRMEPDGTPYARHLEGIRDRRIRDGVPVEGREHDT